MILDKFRKYFTLSARAHQTFVAQAGELAIFRLFLICYLFCCSCFTCAPLMFLATERASYLYFRCRWFVSYLFFLLTAGKMSRSSENTLCSYLLGLHRRWWVAFATFSNPHKNVLEGHTESSRQRFLFIVIEHAGLVHCRCILLFVRYVAFSFVPTDRFESSLRVDIFWFHLHVEYFFLFHLRLFWFGISAKILPPTRALRFQCCNQLYFFFFRSAGAQTEDVRM